MKPKKEELALLHSFGYSISYDPNTLEKFKTFVFPKDFELTQVIQAAHSKGGLLVDRHKMYRPGPASAKHCSGAAKGYDEIFALFEQQTTEKLQIAEETCNFFFLLEENLPQDHPWKKNKSSEFLQSVRIIAD